MDNRMNIFYVWLSSLYFKYSLNSIEERLFYGVLLRYFSVMFASKSIKYSFDRGIL